MTSTPVARIEDLQVSFATDAGPVDAVRRLSLDVREREVLGELIRGHYNKTIADHLGITQRTVEFHRANIFTKLGVQSAIELAHQLGRLEGLPPTPGDATPPIPSP